MFLAGGQALLSLQLLQSWGTAGRGKEGKTLQSWQSPALLSQCAEKSCVWLKGGRGGCFQAVLVAAVTRRGAVGGCASTARGRAEGSAEHCWKIRARMGKSVSWAGLTAVPACFVSLVLHLSWLCPGQGEHLAQALCSHRERPGEQARARAGCRLTPAPRAHPALTGACRESCSLQPFQAVTSDTAQLTLVLKKTPDTCLEGPSCL